MSNDGFKFQYKIGDHVKTNFGDDNDLVCFRLRDDEPSFMCTERGCELIPTSGTVITPINKALERYDAEYLAWQQSNIKAGDWVRRLASKVTFESKYYNTQDDGYGLPFKARETKEEIDFFDDPDGVAHHKQMLEPCDPPKPENIKEGQFELEGDSLIALKYMSCWGSVATHDGKPEVVFNAHGGRPVLHPDDLRSIASLLDRYQASIAPA